VKTGINELSVGEFVVTKTKLPRFFSLTDFLIRSFMAVFFRNAETPDRVALEVELDKDACLIAHDPGVMAGCHGKNARGDVILNAAVAEEDADAAPGQKTHMSVHAVIRLRHGLHLGRPAKSGRVDHAFHPGGAGGDDIQFNAADIAVIGSRNGGEKGVSTHLEFLLLDWFFSYVKCSPLKGMLLSFIAEWFADEAGSSHLFCL